MSHKDKWHNFNKFLDRFRKIEWTNSICFGKEFKNLDTFCKNAYVYFVIYLSCIYILLVPLHPLIDCIDVGNFQRKQTIWGTSPLHVMYEIIIISKKFQSICPKWLAKFYLIAGISDSCVCVLLNKRLSLRIQDKEINYMLNLYANNK